VSGDWKSELAPYPSISNADERNLEFFGEHGDTIVAGSATSVMDFWLKHNEVYSTYHNLNTWADLRSSTSILATIDDNDVRNDFAGGASPSSDPNFSGYPGNYINETTLYSNALQAFQEYNPLRNEFYGATGDNRTANKRKLYRFNTYGSDAAVFVLDTRSFRDEQLSPPTGPGDIDSFLTNTFIATRTIVGSQQLADLKDDLQKAQDDNITWKFILTPSPIQNVGLAKAEDRWEGYAAERTNLLKFINDHNIENVVFVAAGLHGTIVNNLTYQKTYPGNHIPTNAFEVIVGPVAIDPPAGPFGPTAVELAFSQDLISPSEKDTYDNSTREGKDAFVQQLIDDKLLGLLDFIIDPLNIYTNYDLTGLDGSSINATLLQGGYVAAHTYGWTEFEIDKYTQFLTVTTYGIDYYTQTLLANNPNAVITRTPIIVSQFIVTPTNFSPPPYLSITKTATPTGGSVEPGDWITYTITVVNNGSLASNVVISDTLDLSKVTLVTSQTTNGTLSTSNPVQVTGFDLGTGQGVTLTLGVTVTITSATTITNMATVDSDQTDPQDSNSISHAVQEAGSSGPGTNSVYLPIVLKKL
jgi:3-phytase/alkaline phosphatase D